MGARLSTITTITIITTTITIIIIIIIITSNDNNNNNNDNTNSNSSSSSKSCLFVSMLQPHSRAPHKAVKHRLWQAIRTWLKQPKDCVTVSFQHFMFVFAA